MPYLTVKLSGPIFVHAAGRRRGVLVLLGDPSLWGAVLAEDFLPKFGFLGVFLCSIDEVVGGVIPFVHSLLQLLLQPPVELGGLGVLEVDDVLALLLSKANIHY